MVESTAAASPIIEAAGLTKSFRTLKRKPGLKGAIQNLFSGEYVEVKAVENVSFRIMPGELVGYLGPNGAGKSTTIKMLTGILHPTSGGVVVDGLVPQKERIKNARKIAVVFGQRTQLFWDLPAMDSFELMKKLYGIPKPRWEENVKYFTALLGLDEFMSRPVRQLSLGQRMRCELAAALLHDPGIIYLDEPTIGVDVVAKERIREFILTLGRDRGTTVLLTTHDMGDIERLCQRVIIIDKGRLLYDGTLAEIKRRYCHLRRVVFSLAPGSDGGGFEASLRSLDPSISVQKKDANVVVGFDPQKIPATDVTRHVVNTFPVMDLAVEEADLEAIIREIYQQGMRQ